MTDGSTTQARPIEWPKPIINNSDRALEDAGSMIERLRSLLGSNNEEMLQHVLSDEAVPDCAAHIWDQYILAAEELGRIDAVVVEIIEANLKDRRSSVGRHVDIKLVAEFALAMGTWRNASAVPVPPDCDNDTFDKIGNAASDAFGKMLDAPSPHLRAFHEKLSEINKHEAWSNTGVADAILADVERLARRYEITSVAGGEG